MAQEAPPWHAAFPPPRSTPPSVSREMLFRIFTHVGDFQNGGPLLIDVRRTDFEGGTIQGSLNIPAQSFYMNRATLYKLCQGIGLGRIIFYCGSSSGRGPRCAGWFADYIADAIAVSDPDDPPARLEVFVLEGGIKSWATAGPEYVRFIDGYDEEYWRQFTPEAKTEEKTREGTQGEQGEEDMVPESPNKKRKGLDG